VRHAFALAAIERSGPEVLRVVGDPDDVRPDGSADLAAVVLVDANVVAPCGDPEALRRAGNPVRRWRLLVGDRAAGDALLDVSEPGAGLVVHDQRFLTVEPGGVPSAAAIPDPGLRHAVEADIDALATLAVRLHVDDRFGPDPGSFGWAGYRVRMAEAVARGTVRCVGPVGAPTAKLERSVSSHRWGVQLAGIVVEPVARGRGVGTGMVAAAVREALAEIGGPVSLHVREDNVAALAAYRSAGFVDREAWRLALRG
jgi:ribosomal protein S18 acetylase RimI-like enzyme